MVARIKPFIVFLVLIMVFSNVSFPSQAVAQGPSGEGQGIPVQPPGSAEEDGSPDVDDYLWIAGSSFHPRNSSVNFEYVGAGCITSLTGGTSTNESFTVSFRLPDGSTIKGLRFYYYDSSNLGSYLTVTSYDGAGGYVDHVGVYSEGEEGFGSSYVPLTEPYTVSSFDDAFVVNWYPDEAGYTMQLCGARLFYDVGPGPAAEPVDDEVLPSPDSDIPEANPEAAGYRFLAGSAFYPRESNTNYHYGFSGCTYITGGGDTLTIDLDLPQGARVYGVRFFYYDNDPLDSFNFYLTDYDAQGVFRDLLTETSVDGGYNSIYAEVSSGYDPYTVDQFTHSLNIIVKDGFGPNMQFCGARAFYETPAKSDLPEAEQPSGDTTGSVPPLDGELHIQTPDALPVQDFTHVMQLPDGVSVEGVRLYYYSMQAPDGFLDSWIFDGETANFVGTVIGDLYDGYNSSYAPYDVPYTVDNYIGSLNIVSFVPFNPTYTFCGARVYYVEDSTSYYRFIAGSAFHPRNSTTRYEYIGGGCISVIQSDLFLPITRR